METSPSRSSNRLVVVMLVGSMAVIGCTFVVLLFSFASHAVERRRTVNGLVHDRKFELRVSMDTSGFTSVVETLPRWKPETTLEDLSRIWADAGHRNIAEIDVALSNPGNCVPAIDSSCYLQKSHVLELRGRAASGLRGLEPMRPWVESEDGLVGEGSLFADLFPGGNGPVPGRDG